jgi:hypothetical protein
MLHARPLHPTRLILQILVGWAGSVRVMCEVQPRATEEWLDSTSMSRVLRFLPLFAFGVSCDAGPPSIAGIPPCVNLSVCTTLYSVRVGEGQLPAVCRNSGHLFTHAMAHPRGKGLWMRGPCGFPMDILVGGKRDWVLLGLTEKELEIQPHGL